MGQGTNGLGSLPPPDELELEVERRLSGLATIVDELDHRRHELLDWRLQVQAHARTLGKAAAVAAVIGVVAIAISVRRNRQRRRLVARAERVTEALSRILEHPDRVARPEPSATRRALTGLVTGVAGLIVRKLAEGAAARPRYPSLRRVQ
jgi:hypothetical protein